MIPSLDIDPFCQVFFDDPFPAHAAMRDAGPVAAWATQALPFSSATQHGSACATGH
jgi:hypothetical protein